MSLNVNNNVGYTVKGSPTINDGVVSGCDYHNYLNLNSLFPDINNSDMDVFITLKSAGIGTGKGFRNVFSNLCGTIISLTDSSTPAFIVYTKKSGESTYTKRDIYNYSAQVDSNNNFYLHFTKKGNVLSIQGANNDGVFKTASTYTLEEGEEIAVSSNYPEVMRADPWSSIENSAIDLNHTYIKVNGITWFNGKEQASPTVNEVYLNRNVGYIVKGNPTINDGVVSGFSNNNYLQIQNAATTLSNSSTFEIITKFKILSMKGWQIINKMWTTPTNFEGGLSTQNGKVKWYIYNNIVSTSMTCDTVLSKDVWYYAKQTKINNVYSVSWSNDGITWYDTKEIELADAGFFNTFLYGNNQGYGNENLFIDLNETYIKVNGVTWFNGKQTATTPIWTRSV